MTFADRTLIETALTSGDPLWLPGLTRPLVDRQWTWLAQECRLDPLSYGAARVRQKSREAERHVAARLTLPDPFGPRAPLNLEVLSQDAGRACRELGLRLADAASVASPAVLKALGAAFDRLATLPDLAASIGLLVHSLHVATPDAPDYDVSYSDPELPFSIFVGVSATPGRHGDLRLAESILHEAMHLQLSLVEDVTPLVSVSNELHYSPWQRRLRPPQGILHGLYVFAVIRDVMVRMMMAGTLSAEERDHAASRVKDCDAEIAAAGADLAAGGALTDVGRTLLRRMMRPDARQAS